MRVPLRSSSMWVATLVAWPAIETLLIALPAGLAQAQTAVYLPGLGSSPEGASYSCQDSGLANGVTYCYELEDIETTGRTKRDGPVSAVPRETGIEIEEGPSSRITYGDPGEDDLSVDGIGPGLCSRQR